MGRTLTCICVVIGGILLIGAGAGLYFIFTPAIGIGSMMAGTALLAVGLWLMRREAPYQPRWGDVEPPVGTQFLCPTCHAVVSIEESRCSTCGREFVEDAFQCPKCRATVPIESEECPKCGFLFVEKEYGVCPNCKEHIDINATECPYCGERIWSALRPPMKVLACPSCRAPVKETDTRCPSCGFGLGEGEA